MGIYDVLGEMTQKQVMKTENGDNRIFGAVIGTVTNNYAQEMPGRVCVEIPTRDSQHNELKWARVAMPSSGSTWGHYFLPEVGDQVLVVFEQGNIEKPYIIGCIPKDNNQFLTKSVDEKNTYKKIITKHGSTVLFTDVGDDSASNGEKDKIAIYTPEKAHNFLMDNENKVISVFDKEKKNIIEMKTEAGEVLVNCEKKITMKVGDNITVTMSGSTGTVEIKAKKFKVSEVDGIEMEANKQFKVSAATSVMSGSSSAKISGGPVTIEGSPIKIG